VGKEKEMPLYEVAYSARKVGAIGTFYPCYVQVEAGNEADARQKAFDQLHESNHETNYPISVKEIPID
jgi:hypothetical protein